MKINIMVISVLLVIVVNTSCIEEEENTPVVTTADVTSVTDSSAVCGGRVVSDGGSDVKERGVLFSAEGILILGLSSQTSDGSGKGIFISHLESLSPNTTYYVQAYATNSTGTAYGEEVEFLTLP